MKNQSFASSVFYSLTLLALSATLLLAGCKEDASTTAPYTIDLAVLPIVFVMDAEQAAMATGTGTGWGSSDNSGRSNTDICCPSIQIIGETFSDDLRLARPDDAFIENPFGMMIDTDPADPIVIELKDADGNSVGTFSLQVDKGEGIAINEPKLSPGEYLLNITVGPNKASTFFMVNP